MEKQVFPPAQEIKYEKLLDSMRLACKKIAPIWPLKNFVAVNPYLGLSDQKFENAAQNLAKVGGIQMTLPTSFYLQKIKEGKIKREDLAFVLSKNSAEKMGLMRLSKS